MDVSQLKSLGEVAGIGGIALGVVVLLVRPLIATVAGPPKDARAGPVKLIAIGCFAIGVLGIATWTISGQLKGPEVSTLGSQSPGVISGGDTTINFGPSPATQSGSPPANTQNLPAPSGAVHTEGAQSPGVIAGGKVGIELAPTPPPTSGAK